MDLAQAIELRCSRRKYSATPIEPQIAAMLQALIDEYNKEAGIRMELVVNNGRAFNGFARSYGMFSGVNDYVGLFAEKNDNTAAERLGYYGEMLMLNAVAMGLGTCWVGGTFSRSNMPFIIEDSETLICTLVVGNVDTKDSFKERLIHRLTHRKTKSADKMYVSDSPVPDWFMSGMRAVQRAPSAVNRQPVTFTYKDGIVSAEVTNISEASYALDFGIAKLHFEIGSGGGKWAWGNNAGFDKDSPFDYSE